MLRIAIFGVGWAGTRQVQAVRELGQKVAVECLVDSDAAFLRAKAEELGVRKTYTDWREALADPEVDAVSICLPHALHCPVALEAAAAGKQILCEKPLALTVEDATRMIEAAEASGMTLYVAENEPYRPMAKLLREIVRTGRYIGELTFATFAAGFRAPRFGYPERRAWLTLPEQGGTGTWMLHGIHSMAQLRFILGEVETVYMQERHARSFERTDLEGTMSGLLTLESGLPVSVVQTCETRLPVSLGGYVLHGDQGSLRATRDGCKVFTGGREGEEPLFLPYPEEALSDYAQEIEAFAVTVSGVAEGPTTALSERRSLAIVQAGYESARSGRAVCLRERFGEL
jgi:predicted dehydrogenase